jgi:hypothetical protein
MSRSINQVPTLRRLARVYRRRLALTVPAALASCQGAVDPSAVSQSPRISGLY